MLISKEGTYSGGSPTLDINRSGTSSSWITIKCETPPNLTTQTWYCKVNGNNNSSEEGVRFGTSASYIRFEDFEIYGQESNAIVIRSDSQTVPNAWAHHIYIYRNKIHDIARHADATTYGNNGVVADHPCSDTTIDSCLMYKISRLNPYTTPSLPESSCIAGGINYCYSHDHATYLRGDNNVIKNNVFYDFQGGAVTGGGGNANYPTNNVLITNNTFYGKNPGRHGQVGVDYAGSNVTIQNNISYDPQDAFVWFWASTVSNVVIKNNLVYGSAFKLGDNTTNLGLAYCDYACNYTQSGNQVGTTSTYDPKFANLINRDFHIMSASPAINKGLAYAGRTVDADGKSIVGLPDLGAYEYGGGTSDTTAPAAPAGVKAN
jgi:hypothetical protein